MSLKHTVYSRSHLESQRLGCFLALQKQSVFHFFTVSRVFSEEIEIIMKRDRLFEMSKSNPHVEIKPI